MDNRNADAAGTAPDYRRSADEAIKRLCGVSYAELLEICPGLDGNGASLAECERQGVPPAKFAEAFRRAHGFHSALETGAGSARELNERRAALIEFAAHSRWNIQGAGPATMETASGTLRLDVVSKDGQLGFGVAREGEDPYVRLDIGDAVKGAMLLLRRDQGPAPEAPSSGMRMG